MTPLRISVCVLAVSLWCAALAAAQTNPTVRITRRATVMNTPRVDGALVGRVDAGVVLEVLDQYGPWLQVASKTMPGVEGSWTRGWIHQNNVALASGQLNFGAAQSKPRGEQMFRVFGEGGGTFFAAASSFETIFGHARGLTYGGGAQLVLANGLLFQASADRWSRTGSRVLVSGDQIYRLDIPDTVTMTTAQGTIGYREAASRRAAGYVGAGAGWLMYKEESPAIAQAHSKGHFLLHADLGGEYQLAHGVWASGEVQFRAVPKALSDDGIGPVYHETNLGGATFLFRLMVGH